MLGWALKLALGFSPGLQGFYSLYIELSPWTCSICHSDDLVIVIHDNNCNDKIKVELQLPEFDFH